MGDQASVRGSIRFPLFLLGLSVFMAVLYEILPVGLLTPIADDLGVSEQDAGLLVSAFSIIVVIGSIPLAAVTARFDGRLVLVLVLAAFALSAGVMAASQSLPVALAARALGGLGHAVLFTALYRIALSLVPPGRSAVAATTVSVGNALALALGVPIATVVGTVASWRVPFVIVAGLFVALIVTVIAFVPSGRQVEARSFTAGAVLRAAVEPSVLRVALVIVVVLTAQFLAYTYVEPMLLSADVSAGSIGFILMGYGVASVLGLLSVARFTHTRPAAALRIAVATIAAAILLVWLARDSGIALSIAVVLWGFGFGLLPVLLNVAALRASHRLPEAAASVSNTAFNIGITAGAIIGGQVVASAGTGPLGLIGAVVMALVAVLLLAPGWLPRDGSTADDAQKH